MLALVGRYAGGNLGRLCLGGPTIGGRVCSAATIAKNGRLVRETLWFGQGVIGTQRFLIGLLQESRDVQEMRGGL